MALFGYGLWPLMAVGGLLLMISLLFCLYLYRLRRTAEVEKGFKMIAFFVAQLLRIIFVKTRYGAFAVFSTQALCPICLEDYRLGEKIAKSHCSHSFHLQCLQPWLKQHNTCPMCKKNLKPAPRPAIPHNV